MTTDALIFIFAAAGAITIIGALIVLVLDALISYFRNRGQ